MCSTNTSYKGIKPLLQFQLKNTNDLFEMLQDFYFSRTIHDQVVLMIDDKWLIQKEDKEFSCKQSINVDERVRVDFAHHPQTFLKTVLRGKTDSPQLRIYARD